MIDRPTPETDAFSVKFKSLCGNKEWVPVDFSRRLERERDEAREALNRITEAANAVVDRWEQPSWKDTEPTALVIYKLKSVLKEQNK